MVCVVPARNGCLESCILEKFCPSSFWKNSILALLFKHRLLWSKTSLGVAFHDETIFSEDVITDQKEVRVQLYYPPLATGARKKFCARKPC